MNEYEIHGITCIRCKKQGDGIGNDMYAYCIQCMQDRDEYRNNLLIKHPYSKFNAEIHDAFSDKTVEISYDMDESELKELFETFSSQSEFDSIIIKKINQ